MQGDIPSDVLDRLYELSKQHAQQLADTYRHGVRLGRRLERARIIETIRTAQGCTLSEIVEKVEARELYPPPLPTHPKLFYKR